jgi:2-dehydro-3-deoxy-D-arabinonate dehydratase
VGPAIVPADGVKPPFQVRTEIVRAGDIVFEGSVSTEHMRRSFEELADWLGRGLRFPVGVVLLTGTGIVPGPPFTLRHGDDVRIAVSGLGVLRNPVALAGDAGGDIGTAAPLPATRAT